MTIDVDHQISAVRRSLGTRTLEAGESRVLTISQTYPAPVDDVWDAVTSAERIPRWLMPISGDLRVGGRYQLEGQAGGEVLTCEAPQSFTATWEYGGQVSWIEVALTAEGDGTRLTLEHVAHVDDDMWSQFGPGAVGVGWDSMLLGLALHLTSGEAMSPEEGAAWAATDEGRRFMTLSSEAWREASIAFGTPADQARAAADRTTAAYTGAPDPTDGADPTDGPDQND